MKPIERQVFGRLIEQAKASGFSCVRFACTPATGEQGEEIVGEALELASCVAHADAWDSNSVAEFSTKDGLHFWVLLVWGNDEDVISDYVNTPHASRVVEAVYDWIERGMKPPADVPTPRPGGHLLDDPTFREEYMHGGER